MLRCFTIAIVFLSASFVRASDDEPSYSGKKVSEWVAQVEGSQELAQRRLALYALGAAADHSHVWQRSTNKRKVALRVLEIAFGPAKSKKVMPAFVNALQNDPEESVRASAALGLGKMRAKCRKEKQEFTYARDALFAALRNDSSGSVREAAASALGIMAKEEDHEEVQAAVPTLIERLKDEYPPVRSAAAEVLFYLGRDGREASFALHKTVEDSNNDVPTRVWAALALGKIGPPEAAAMLPALQKVLANDKTPREVREAILKSLGKFGKDAEPALPLIAKLLNDEANVVELRREAVSALDALGSDAKGAIGALKKAARDKDKFIRSTAVTTFGKIGSGLGTEVKNVTAILLQAVDDPLIDVRLAAIETLGNLGSKVLGDEIKPVRERLTTLSEGSEKEIREAAQSALKKIGS